MREPVVVEKACDAREPISAGGLRLTLRRAGSFRALRRTVLFCALLVYSLLGAFVFSPPALAQSAISSLSQAVSDLNAGSISPEQFTDVLTSQSDFSPEALAVVKQADLTDAQRRAAVSGRLMRKVEEVLVSRSSANASGLRRAARVLLGETSDEYRQLLKLFNIVDQAEHFAATDNLPALVNLREEMTTPAEKRLLEVKIARFLSASAEDNVRQHKAEFALRELAEIKADWRTTAVNELAARAIVALEREIPDKVADPKFAKLFDEPVVQELMGGVAKADPGAAIALAGIYSARTDDALKRGAVDQAQTFFAQVVRYRPDPSTENDRLRLEAAFSAKDEATRSFAAQRIAELKAAGSLRLVDKVKLLTSGYYSGTLRIVTFVIVGLVGLVVFFAVLVRIIPLIAGSLPKGGRKKRGYMREVSEHQPADEYSRLLAIFGLDDNATEDQIKKTYRQIVKEYHPDSAGQQSEEHTKRFVELREAYERILQIRSSWFGR